MDLAGFEGIVRKEFGKPEDAVDLLVIDEIGKMECCSGVFVEAVARALDSPVAVLATIAVRGGGFIEEVKRRADVEIMPVSPGNREGLPEFWKHCINTRSTLSISMPSLNVILLIKRSWCLDSTIWIEPSKSCRRQISKLWTLLGCIIFKVP